VSQLKAIQNLLGKAGRDLWRDPSPGNKIISIQMIKFQYQTHFGQMLLCPICICETCGLQITDGKQAVIDFEMTSMEACALSTANLRTYHAGDCAPKKAPGTLNVMLDQFAIQLCINMGVDADKFLEIAKQLDKLEQAKPGDDSAPT
tara:strand:+ start:5889 stop:6329 length:441 start_codon:yes stop_codon:yes gene_type:complete